MLMLLQGTRAHWTCENTTMHLVRFVNGVVLIDEYDLVGSRCCIRRIAIDHLQEYPKPLLCFQLLFHYSGIDLRMAWVWVTSSRKEGRSRVCPNPISGSRFAYRTSGGRNRRRRNVLDDTWRRRLREGRLLEVATFIFRDGPPHLES